jgi:hypothetical protein
MRRRLTLIVLAVIMVALAYTLYNCVRFYVRAYPCEMNVENIAMATRMYAADWDECLPHPDHWVDQVGPEYVGNMAVFKCPADKSGARRYMRSQTRTTWYLSTKPRTPATIHPAARGRCGPTSAPRVEVPVPEMASREHVRVRKWKALAQ